MYRITLIITMLLAGTATAGTFNPMPYLADNQVDVLSRQVANQTVDRDLFEAPYATVIVGNVDIYDRFPFLEARYFQVVSDPGWNRLVFGELDKGLQAFDGQGSSFGPLNSPRGMSVDDQGQVYVADTDNNRVLVFKTVTEYDRITLVPQFAITDLNQPYDVAFSDGGTPFSADDDVLYVANTGQNEIRCYSLTGGKANLTSSLGTLGSRPGDFAGPLALTVGREAGSHTTDIYVADAHNGRLVQLRDNNGSLQWVGQQVHDLGAVTSLTSDHWGNVYATSPQGGVVKYTAGLKSVAGSLATTTRPRAFHVPSVTISDHRNGTRQRLSEGRGVLVEEWDSGSGLRVMGLGVEVQNPVLVPGSEASVDVFLTDHAELTVELSDPDSGEVVSVNRAGLHAAGAQRVALQATDDLAGWEAGEYLLTVHAKSTYDTEPDSEVQLTVSLARAGDPDLPRSLKVVGNSPNPFNPSTVISFLVPVGASDEFSLNVYDPRGRLVRRLESGAPTPGLHTVVWDGRDDNGESAGSGVYLYRVVLGAEKSTGKMTLLK